MDESQTNEVIELPEARNPVWTFTGMINLEINHPTLGWIPFSASANDPGMGAALFEQAMLGAYGPIAPYVPPVKTPEQIRAEFEEARAISVKAITVTVDELTTFGDEASQNRMARAILVLQGKVVGTQLPWEMTDFSRVLVDKPWLLAALEAARTAQDDLWFQA